MLMNWAMIKYTVQQKRTSQATQGDRMRGSSSLSPTKRCSLKKGIRYSLKGELPTFPARYSPISSENLNSSEIRVVPSKSDARQSNTIAEAGVITNTFRSQVECHSID